MHTSPSCSPPANLASIGAIFHARVRVAGGGPFLGNFRVRLGLERVAPRYPRWSKSWIDHPGQRNIRDSEMADEKNI